MTGDSPNQASSGRDVFVSYASQNWRQPHPARQGKRDDRDPPIKRIRYQLLTACAGAIVEAEQKRCSRALVLVHEFVTDKTKDSNHRRNAADLNLFLWRISHGIVREIADREIVGPFRIPGFPGRENCTDLYFGKVSRNIRKIA